MKFPQLIALDMDGTLLDGAGEIPNDFWLLLDRAHKLGVTIAPASGRQLATLQHMFGTDMSFIAENGTAVFHQGELVSVAAIETTIVNQVLAALADVSVPHFPIVCTPHKAFIPQELSAENRAEVEKYYVSNESVSSFDDVIRDNDIIKIAIFCASGAEENIAPIIYPAAGDSDVAISGHAWLDVMPAGINKGMALRNLASALNIPADETAAFGDFLNDFELLQAAGTAVAMKNAHPKLKEIADIIADSNEDHGVITMIQRWFDNPASIQP
ncbi:MAG: HAD family hydrolase [Corynebacterium sp.]|nr:HAD family hydrolase [Corynebacterium sp.]